MVYEREGREMGTIGVGELPQWEKAEGGGEGGGKEEKIFVSVRIRPLNGKEMERSDRSDWECINTTTIIFKNSVPDRSMYPTAYTFDRVFGSETGTRHVYEEGAKEVALSVVSGINASVFAYGQTSSGKTYTMSGITEYAVSDIYDYIKKHEEREFVLKFSAMEIYNESVRDLLSMDSSPLRLLDDPERGTIVEKLTEETLRDQNHLKELLSVCEAQRQIGETSLNEMSSRSHQILRLTIESSAREYVGRGSSSTLTAAVNFVDLAGSERASQALSAGARLKEGCHINRSLLTLGTVIRKLSKGRNGHIPFRDSKLTRILQSSLGGNARTAIICTMSPARSHIEQSRNTLLFASCAKEVVTNAQVNVVMSDKALVKYLQRELARLENELRYPSCTSHYETLKDKDSQIKKMEQEIKELMRQRNLAQSRLEDLLRGVADDQASNRWDESSQSFICHARNASEDALSVSELSGITHQFINFESTRLHTPDKGDICDAYHLKLSDKMEGQHTSPTYSISSSTYIGIIPQQKMAKIAEATIEDSEEQCKEVRCIEIHELSTRRSDEFNLLLADESDSLLPLTEEDKLGDPDIRFIGQMHLSHAKEQRAECLTSVNDKFVKSSIDEASPWSSVQKAMNFKEPVLNRSRSCKASLISSQNTSWLEELEQDIAKQVNQMPTNSLLKEVYIKSSSLRYDAEKESVALQLSQVSKEISLSNVGLIQGFQTATEEDTSSILSSSAQSDKMAQSQHQKLLSDDEGTHQESEELGMKTIVKDLGVDSMRSSEAPPSAWPLEFEKKQLEIIELWHACNVSLFHRTCFFLLFKGDPADTFYMEVEHRRLSFLQNTFSHGIPNVMRAKDGDMVNLASSLKQLRREREMLYRQLLKMLSPDERQDLYTKWGIDLNSKQRRLQISRQMWTKTDMEHVKESALLVAKLIGLQDHEQAPKEMFGLSFTPQHITTRSFSWKHGSSSFM